MKVKWKSENIAAVLFMLFVFLYPLFSNDYRTDNFTGFLIMAVLTISLSVIWGYGGIFSFGQVVFYGLGAYGYSICRSAVEGDATILAVIIGILVPGIVAAIIGYFLFYGKVNDIFIGVVTMCIALLLETFLIQTSDAKWKIAGVHLGGYNGINYVRPFFDMGEKSLYYVAALVLLLIYLAARYIPKTNYGYALFGLKENKERCKLLGYDTAWLQTSVFTLGGLVGGVAGVMFSSWSGYAMPSNVGMAASNVIIVVVVAAGKDSITGAIILSVLYSRFSQFLSSQGSEYSNIILGSILILVVILIPDGIMSTLFRKIDQFTWKRVIKEGPAHE